MKLCIYTLARLNGVLHKSLLSVCVPAVVVGLRLCKMQSSFHC
jgi:hypothetical protein